MWGTAKRTCLRNNEPWSVDLMMILWLACCLAVLRSANTICLSFAFLGERTNVRHPASAVHARMAGLRRALSTLRKPCGL